jgi:hypothetical protein
MLTKTLLAFACAALVIVGLPVEITAQNDLDSFMERVLARRDDNWKKLQQYVLDEREAFDLTGPGGLPLWGMRRDYTWFIRQGVFVRSPLKANGVTVSDADRRKAEAEWLRRESQREERRKRRAEKIAAQEPLGPDDRGSITVGPQGVDVDMVDVLKQGGEPQFVSSSYFLKFRFEKGHYALAGRESIDGVQALKIEYYPVAGLFNDGRERPNKKVRDEDAKIEQKMNKVSLVTLWVEPKSYQILQYTFDDIDMDFFPGRSLARIDDLKATMRMAQQFPNIWLPKNIDMKFAMTLAVGTVEASYRVDYHDYKEAAVTYKIK